MSEIVTFISCENDKEAAETKVNDLYKETMGEYPRQKYAVVPYEDDWLVFSIFDPALRSWPPAVVTVK